MLELHVRADKSGERPTNEDGSPGRWPIKHVELVGKAPRDWNPSDTFVARALGDGYLEIEKPTTQVTEGYERNPVVTGSALRLKLKGADVVYTIVEAPGRYADDSEPSGYRVTHEYRCRLKGGK